MANKNKTCFVIAPIGPEGSDTRKRSDQLLKHVLEAALEPRGYEVVRADRISQPGSITIQVLEHVINSEIVVADLTDHNPNVFYELAVRHAVQKPLIHMILSGQSIPFDVADFRTIQFELDLDGAEAAREGLIAQLEELEKGKVGVTPVKLANILQADSSQSEEKLILRQLIEGMSELRSEMRSAVEMSSHRATNQMAEISELLHEIYQRLRVRAAAPKPTNEIAERQDTEGAHHDPDALIGLEEALRRSLDKNKALEELVKQGIRVRPIERGK